MGEVQSETTEIEEKKEEKKKAKRKEKTEETQKLDETTLDLLKIIKNQQDQIATVQAQMIKTSDDIDKLKEAHNKMVDVMEEIGKSIESGGAKSGGLGELAVLIKAIAPLMREERSSPFEAIGVYTFKQFMRTQFGKKAVREMMKTEKKGKKETEEEEESEEE